MARCFHPEDRKTTRRASGRTGGLKANRPRRSLSEGFARKARKKVQSKAEVDELLRLACELVPLDSGYAEFGTGKFMYTKVRNECGSVRVFRFRDYATCMQAMQLGMAHDTWPAEAMRSETVGRA